MYKHYPKYASEKETRRIFTEHYHFLRGIYPHIPDRVEIRFAWYMPESLADCHLYKDYADIRFNRWYLRLFKHYIREFLHEMAHIVWPGIPHGIEFEVKVFQLRSQLFSHNIPIY